VSIIKMKKKISVRSCLTCGNLVRIIPCRDLIGKNKYCSKKCYYTARKGVHVSPQSEFKKGHPHGKRIRLGQHFSPKTEFKKGKHYSIATQFKKGQLGLKGKDNPNWKGGITPINTQIRMSTRYKNWRIAIFKRDYFTCQECGYESKGKRPSDIDADHIKPFALFPKLRFDINNDRTLCKPCHKLTETYGWKILNR